MDDDYDEDDGRAVAEALAEARMLARMPEAGMRGAKPKLIDSSSGSNGLVVNLHAEIDDELELQKGGCANTSPGHQRPPVSIPRVPVTVTVTPQYKTSPGNEEDSDDSSDLSEIACVRRRKTLKIEAANKKLLKKDKKKEEIEEEQEIKETLGNPKRSLLLQHRAIPNHRPQFFASPKTGTTG